VGIAAGVGALSESVGVGGASAVVSRAEPALDGGDVEARRRRNAIAAPDPRRLRSMHRIAMGAGMEQERRHSRRRASGGEQKEDRQDM
jgi:hypothetical protein